ncbi:MAG: signal recognition particle-docking protein FtsY [Cenarchaeum sp. SB0664_bin_35]|nr:signal recognition particle-docking protein FtsY [Cenarchaeum sp. SB0664_bin_35]
MFDSLRKSFTRFSQTIAERDLSESDIEEVLEDLEMSLLQSDVALEVVEEIGLDLKRRLVGTAVNKKQLESFVRGALTESVSRLFQNAGSLDLFERIREKNARDEPYVIVFLGINGTGKTTTLAKFAYMLKSNNFTVTVAAADTFRAGAIEQIREHAEKLQVRIIAQNYNSDPAAVCRDAVLYAKSHRTNCVLIDTAGRIQTSTNLMQQIEKITNVVNPDLKIFVGDSLAGNDAISQAREFHDYTSFDCSVLTKSDADTKGGSALSIVKITSKPILYLGVGQEYPDLKEFRWESFVEAILGERESMDEELAAKIQAALVAPASTDNNDVLYDDIVSDTKDETEAAGIHDAKSVPEHKQADPFEGISDSDIAVYSEMHDVPPPESDEAAHVLASDIKNWIVSGRPIREGAQPSAVKEQVNSEETALDVTDDKTIKQEPNHATESTDSNMQESKPQGAVAEDAKIIPDAKSDEQQSPASADMPASQESYNIIKELEGETGQKSRDIQADPFEGISDSDIAVYSEMHDVPPPESDEAAHVLASDIKDWIAKDRPVHKEFAESTVVEKKFQDMDDGGPTPDTEIDDEPAAQEMPESEKESGRKHKKKRGMFGFFRR